MYGFITCINVYKWIGNANGCSSTGCRTMVTIEEESIHDTSNHQGEAQHPSIYNPRYHLTMQFLPLFH